MSGGRPPKGPRLLDSLEGSEVAKEKARVILETIAGEIPIGEACRRLGCREAMFHRLRSQMLRSAIAGLEPKPIGRPRKESAVDPRRIEALEGECADLRREDRLWRLRDEIVRTMPGVLVKRERRKKKTRR